MSAVSIFRRAKSFRLNSTTVYFCCRVIHCMTLAHAYHSVHFKGKYMESKLLLGGKVNVCWLLMPSTTTMYLSLISNVDGLLHAHTCKRLRQSQAVVELAGLTDDNAEIRHMERKNEINR